MAWGSVAAVAVGVASHVGGRAVRAVARIYVEVLRGVSAIILIFWVYFALPLMGIDLSPLQAGVLALGLNLSAYGAEIVRGSLASVPAGQREAAIAVHLRPARRLWSVQLPQAALIALPPYGNLVIEVMKSSALVSLISLSDLTREAQNMRLLRTADSVDIFAAVLVIYLVISLGITAVFRALERRLAAGALGVRAGRPAS